MVIFLGHVRPFRDCMDLTLSVTLPLSGKLFPFDFECGYGHFNSSLTVLFSPLLLDSALFYIDKLAH
jgi:hypothetical protein